MLQWPTYGRKERVTPYSKSTWVYICIMFENDRYRIQTILALSSFMPVVLSTRALLVFNLSISQGCTWGCQKERLKKQSSRDWGAGLRVRTNIENCCSIPPQHSTETSLYSKCCLNATPLHCLLYIHYIFSYYIPVVKGNHIPNKLIFAISFNIVWLCYSGWLLSNILSASSR